MGRLLKKKDAAKKKKKQTDDISSDGIVENKADAESEPRKQQTLRRKKSPTGTSATPGAVQKALSDSVQFLREVKAELRKVAWPSRKQTFGSTVVVIILVLIVSFFLGTADIGLSSLVKLVLG